MYFLHLLFSRPFVRTLLFVCTLSYCLCWLSTPGHSNTVLHELGFPPCGLSRVSRPVVTVSVSSHYVSDFLPDSAFFSMAAREAVRLSTPLCSYEAALITSDSEGSESDMDLSD